MRSTLIVVVTIRTLDAHVGGASLRLIVEGCPSLRGRTMGEKRASAERLADVMRRTVLLEPRGHVDLLGAVLTEPAQPGSDAGVLFMDADGFVAMSGHGVMAVATLALERQLLVPRDPSRMVFDTPAGTVRVAPERRDGRSVDAVTVTNVPSFVVQPGVELSLPGRRLRADVAFGGEFYAIVDAESAGVAVDATRTGDLRRTGMAITAAVDAALAVAHPAIPELSVLAGTVFTAPPQEPGADLRCATVRVSGAVDRSAGGTGMSAIMAVLEAMGLLADAGGFAAEGLAGQRLHGRVRSRTRVAAFDAIVPELTGTAYVTGEHLFIVDAHDPLAGGVRVS